MSGFSRGRSSEAIAQGILEELGYEILETNKMVELNGSRAFEVDILARDPDGESVCIEVKAGRVGVSDVRLAFANGEALGMKPLLVAKGYANRAARALAEELEVSVVKLSEYYTLLEPEELEVVLKSAIREVLDEYGFHPLPPLDSIDEEEWRTLEAIRRAPDFEAAARSLDLSSEDLGTRLGDMRVSGVLPSGGQSFEELKKYAAQALYRRRLQLGLDEISTELKYIKKMIMDLRDAIARDISST